MTGLRKGKRIAVTVLTVLLLGIALGTAFFLVYRDWNARRPDSRADAPSGDEKENVTAHEVPVTPEPSPTPAPTPTPTPYVSPIDFKSLWEVNPHVIGWIDIPGTNIQYPIMQHPVYDDYYLHATFEGLQAEYPGSIYVNLIEGQNFDTFNTVIYGHNMADGTMFAQLTGYYDSEYMKSHREIVIYTPAAEHHYIVCAHVVYNDDYVTRIYDDNNPADRKRFLETLHNQAAGTYWMDDVEVGTEDHIITLQTCIAGMPENRRFIVAVEQNVIPDISHGTITDQGTDIGGIVPDTAAA